MKRIKCLIAAAVLLVVSAAAIIVAFAALNFDVSATKIQSDGELATFEGSFTGETYYSGDKKGNIYETNEKGETVRSLSVFEKEIIQKITVIDENRILVCGSASSVALVDKEFNVLGRLELPGIFMTASFKRTENGDTFWFGISSNANLTDLYLFSYAFDGSEFIDLYGDEFFTLEGDEGEETVKNSNMVARNVTVSEDGKYLYVFAKKGIVYKVSSDLSLLKNDKESLKRFHIANYVAPDEIYTVVYDEDTELFYYALRSGKLVRMTTELKNETIATFPEVVASIRYDRKNKIIYVPYSLSDDLTAVNAEDGSILYSFKAKHNVSYVYAYEKGNKLLIINNEKDFSSAFSYNLSHAKFAGSVKVWKTLLFVLAGVAFVVGAIVLACFLSDAFAAKTAGCIRYFLKGLWKGKLIYLTMLPSLALLIIFCYYPAIASIFNAFYDYSAGTAKIFVGMQNFKDIVQDIYFGEMVRNMFIFMISDCVLALMPPIFFAFCLSIMRNKRYSKFMRFALFFPGILPGIATSLLWKNGIYGEYGAINAILKALHQSPIAFLGSSKTSVGSLVFMGFPWVGLYLIFYGALMNVPPEIYESAELEGCKLWRRLISIDVPFIMGQIKYVFIITFIHSVQSLGKLQATTKGDVGTMTPMYKLYMYLNNNEYGMASAMAVMMMLVLSVVTAINMRNKIKSEASYA